MFRLIETDVKSLNSLQSNSGHSRRSSDTSQVSECLSQMNSETMNDDQNQPNDVWFVWGQVINDWNNYQKKKNGNNTITVVDLFDYIKLENN